MKSEDFEGNKKYKAVLPVLILIHFFILILGPFTFPSYTEVYMLGTMIIGAIKSFHNSGTIIISVWKALQVLNKLKK
jgi:hypothetical protein